MDRYSPLLLDVWREACRHIEIQESLDRLTPLLARSLPLDHLLVRRIDPTRLSLETIAATGGLRESLSAESRTDVPRARMDEILAWCARAEVLRGSSSAARLERSLLVPAGVDGDFLAGPLAIEGSAAGVLLLVANRRRAFSREHEDALRALLEPFSTALENDMRLREMRRLRDAAEAEKLSALSRLGREALTDAIVGADLGLQPVMRRVELVARSDVPVLLLGETGSGKEVIARAIHERSVRSAGPFLRVNCGAISPELIDSELFGHERGSFTGAVSGRRGWFERADGGTLLLDEIGELPLAAQVRLLRILQDGTFERVGGERQLHVDVRLVAATNRDLEAMVAGGRFREDLWYRIAVFPIRIPPLRERSEDIPALAIHFALRASRHFRIRPLAPSPEDLKLLMSYSWPGNVRELAAVIDRAAILGDGKYLDFAAALGSPSQTAGPRPSIENAGTPGGEPFLKLDDAMRRHIEAALRATAGRIEGARGAARLLGINPHTLRARMRKLGIDWGRFRDAGGVLGKPN